MAGNGREELGLFKYIERVEKRFDRLEHEVAATRRTLVALRADFHAFGRQVAKILAGHRKRITALERRAA